jgi:hypothetical protein
MRTPSRYLTVLVMLVIGCAFGCKKKGSNTSGEPDRIKKGISAIVVGPGPCDLNYPNVQISKTDSEVAIWVARKKTDKLRIEFDTEVFEEMTNVNGKWIPKDCGTSRICYSGNIKDTVVPSEHEYKYGQVLIRDNNEESCDGRMIINP